MFSIFKADPMKKLTQTHAILLEKAMHAQRKGDIRLFAQLSHEANEIDKKIVEIENKNSSLTR